MWLCWVELSPDSKLMLRMSSVPVTMASSLVSHLSLGPWQWHPTLAWWWGQSGSSWWWGGGNGGGGSNDYHGGGEEEMVVGAVRMIMVVGVHVDGVS